MITRILVLVGLVLNSSVSTKVFDLKKGVIVHLFEWRWEDIAKECEQYLHSSGYVAVQISPPTENIKINKPPRPWWERYQPVSYRFTTRSGDEDELEDMIKRCNKVGVRIIADVILNHMTGPFEPGEGTAGSTSSYKDFYYPAVPYTAVNFHRPPCAITRYDNATMVRFCELSGIRDLDQSQTHVRVKQLKYLNKLIKMGVAGFRIDAARHIWPVDLKWILDRVDNLSIKHGFQPNTRPFIYHEVNDHGTVHEATKWDEYKDMGLVTDFRYGTEVGAAFLGEKDLEGLKTLDTSGKLLPSDYGVVFIDNHDTQRNPEKSDINYKRFRPYKMATAFMLAYPWGTPCVISGYNFDNFDDGPPHDEEEKIKSPYPITKNKCANGWTCEHRWRQIANVVRFRNIVKGTKVINIQGEGKHLAFCRGNKGFIAFNTDPDKPLCQKFQTCLPEGTYCDIISGYYEKGRCTGKSVHVDEDGTALIEISKFEIDDQDIDSDGVVAIHIKDKIGVENEDDDSTDKTSSFAEELKKWCDCEEKEIVFCDEDKGFIAFTKNKFEVNNKLQTCLPQGTYCDLNSGSLVNNKCTGKIVEVDENGDGIVKGTAAKNSNKNGIIALHINAKIVNKEKCNKEYMKESEKIPSGMSEDKLSLKNEEGKSKVDSSDSSNSSSSSSEEKDHDNICEKLSSAEKCKSEMQTLDFIIGNDHESIITLREFSKQGKSELMQELFTLIK